MEHTHCAAMAKARHCRTFTQRNCYHNVDHSNLFYNIVGIVDTIFMRYTMNNSTSKRNFYPGDHKLTYYNI